MVKDLELTLGSSSAICAVGLARLGNPVVFVANVGADVYGDFCVGVLERERVDVSLVRRRADLKTGITVSVTSPADRALITYLGAIASLTPEDVPVTDFASCGHFHVSSYFLQDGLRGGLRAVFAAARRAGLTTSLDTGWDPREEWSRDLIPILEEVDVFLPNETELQAITGCTDVMRGIEALDNGHTLVVGKLGADGCIARDQGKWIRVGAYPIQVVDTTGAGDSFVAGFLHAWLRRRTIDETLRFATACGALSTRGLGGTTAQATDAEVESYLHAHSGN
jgi:sugar/nucleoside kinase (ribokinase family)